MIHGIPIFLNKWSPSVSLLKEELSRVPVWVKFHDVPLVAYTSDVLSLIATKISTPMMLDSYTNSMCLETWGRSTYARILIEIDVCNGFSVNLVMAIPNLDGPRYTKETICVEYEWEPPRCNNDDGFIEVKKKKSGVNNGGTKNFKPVSMKPKSIYRPKVNQPTKEASPKPAHEVSPRTTHSVGKKNVSTIGNSSKKTGKMNASTYGNCTFSLSNSFEDLNVDNMVTEEVDSGDKAFMSSVQEEGKSSTPLVEKINMFEQQLLERKWVLVDDEDKPLKKKVEYSDDHDSEDKFEYVDNEMESFMASNPSEVGYGTNSLLEQ
ncbi:zinc knuckle CX2CX4HX4C containing protein [Tanacetum coccineum]